MARALRPSEIVDDGLRTYVRWPVGRALPAVFTIDERGREALINGSMQDDRYVIDGVMTRLVFRLDRAERLILIEDTPELEVDQANSTGLIAARSALGEAAVDSEDLLNAALRMRPDRIILGELRGPEAFSFLRAVDQVALLVLQSGARLSQADVVRYVRTTIDVYIQFSRTAGRRYVSHVALRPCDVRV